MRYNKRTSSRKLKEAQALDEAMKQLENQVSKDPSITSGSPFVNEDTDKQKLIMMQFKQLKIYKSNF